MWKLQSTYNSNSVKQKEPKNLNPYQQTTTYTYIHISHFKNHIQINQKDEIFNQNLQELAGLYCISEKN